MEGFAWRLVTGGDFRRAWAENNNAPRILSGRFRPSFGGSDDAGGHWLDPADWLAVPLAQCPELCQLLLAQILIAVSDIAHSIVEPVFLMLGESVDDTATEDMAEQLITSLRK